MASALLDVLSSPDASAKEVQGELESFLAQVGALNKGRAFSAADAKAYGPTLIKMVNTCVKQVWYFGGCHPVFAKSISITSVPYDGTYIRSPPL
jgi:hypothetical protein